jgi:hypothetical protein
VTAAGLPPGRGRPDWRTPDRGALRSLLAMPIQGVPYDVGQNSPAASAVRPSVAFWRDLV